MSVEIPNQKDLWENQHQVRGVIGCEGSVLRNIPNKAAIILGRELSDHSTILEVGSANGRDARYWASLGHRVIATDFSTTALAQLTEIALEQDVLHNIETVEWDISVGRLPVTESASIEAFYARSSLHVDDDTMLSLADHLNYVLKPNGLILIEGKGLVDGKIKRSQVVGKNLVIDQYEGGHLRRVWTQEFFTKICEQFCWNVLKLECFSETIGGYTSNFTRLLAKKN